MPYRCDASGEDSLKLLSVRQTRETFRRILTGNRSVRESVAREKVLVDYRLAEHYDLPAAQLTEHLTPVCFPADSPYGGHYHIPSPIKLPSNGFEFLLSVRSGIPQRSTGRVTPPPIATVRTSINQESPR